MHSSQSQQSFHYCPTRFHFRQKKKERQTEERNGLKTSLSGLEDHSKRIRHCHPTKIYRIHDDNDDTKEQSGLVLYFHCKMKHLLKTLKGFKRLKY